MKKIIKRNASWGSSFKALEWSNNNDITESESSISATIFECYEFMHREVSKEEITFINSLKITKCPYCKGDDITKKGLYFIADNFIKF